MSSYFDVIVIGGGHAGAEAAWAAANMLRPRWDEAGGRAGKVALITMDPTKIGAMSCNPAIGGLAKGQMVREIDALGGLMGLAADATGIQFKVLNASKGPAVRGPRCQSDKYRYAEEVQRLLGTRPNLTVLAGTVDDFVVEGGRCTGVVYAPNPAYCRPWRELEGRANEMLGADCCGGEFSSGPHGGDSEVAPTRLNAQAVVLTTGTFMRALMHTGERKTEGGRIGEGTAVGISGALQRLGFELGRLKTGTPPRLAAETIDFASLQVQPGDAEPVPFSDLTGCRVSGVGCEGSDPTPDTLNPYTRIASRFPVLEQRDCWMTHTNADIHAHIAANVHRAPMYNGQIETQGPRYCPSIEDKVVRFADRTSHHVFLEPESLSTNEIYCNGISTSLPADVQEYIVRHLPGCERATILKYGYAVEYDMVWPHQIDATGMTKKVAGLFLAGQINGTSGYEEAAAQGLVAGINAALWTRGEDRLNASVGGGDVGRAAGPFRLRRDQAYIGVLMDDLVTKTPREPYRMFTSRAEHRLMLRADNTDERLTPLGRELGTVDDVRWGVYQGRQRAIESLRGWMRQAKVDGVPLASWARRPEVNADAVLAQMSGAELPPLPGMARDRRLVDRVLADLQYAGYIDRMKKDIDRLAQDEAKPLPADVDYQRFPGLRTEAALVLNKFRPATLGQAGRLAGVNPSDLMVVSVALGR